MNKDARIKIFEQLPGLYLILCPDHPRYTILDVNEAYLQETGTDKNIIGKGLFEVFPDNPEDAEASGVQNLTASLLRVIHTGKAHKMKIQRYDTKNTAQDGFNLRYWSPVNTPVLGPDNRVKYIIHCVVNVTSEVVLGEKEEQARELLQQIKNERAGLLGKLQMERRQKQKEITDAIVVTQQAERIHIGAELHDNVNQILTTTRLYLEYILQSKETPTHLVQLSNDLVRKAITELKHLSTTLVRPSLKGSLVQAIEELLASVARLNQLAIHTEFYLPAEEKLCPQLKLELYRVVQEQVTNVLKYASAGNLFVSLGLQNNAVHLCIRDDGAGFRPNDCEHGVGLPGMRARIKALGGELSITSSPRNGCKLLALVPVLENKLA